MAAAAGLSGLPDNVLHRILYFAPAKEGASTAVLSRRWRSLWRTSGAVNLDSRSYDRSYVGQYGRRDDVSGKAEAFSRGMEAALSAAATAGGEPVRRLTLHVDECCYDNHYFKAYRRHNGPGHDMVTAFFTSQAARAAEELAVVIPQRQGAIYDKLKNRAVLNFGSLPSETLRSLHASNVGSLEPPPPTAAFLRLAELRLRRCSVSVDDLQRVVDAAPQLARLHLECYSFGERGDTDLHVTSGQKKKFGGRLVCPAVTALVLTDCSWPWPEQGKVELDVPRLQYFRYKGSVSLVKERVFLKLSAAASPGVVWVDLHFDAESWRNARTKVYFWEFLQSFGTAKVLKLKMDLPTDHVALAEQDQGGLEDGLTLRNRTLLHSLEHLEVEVPREPAGKTLALFIANLLRWCPVLRHLHLKLTSKASNRTGMQAWAEFDKSMDHFRHHRRRSPKVLLNADEDENYIVPDIPGLSDHSFDCLKSCLRTVILQFWMQGPDCFEVQLAKFFAENAAVLQEISIDDGNHKLREHMNRMLRKWATGSSKRKNLPTTAAVREFYPSKRTRYG